MAILKYAGAFVGSFVALLVAIFYLYPFLQPDKYTSIVMPEDQIESIMSRVGISAEPHEEIEVLISEVQRLQFKEIELLNLIDSLRYLVLTPEDRAALDAAIEDAVNGDSSLVLTDTLEGSSVDAASVAPVQPAPAPVPVAAAPAAPFQPGGMGAAAPGPVTTPAEDDDALRRRVNSLLNLDEEELGPIIREMSNEELIKLYRVGGNQQREKLLRSLPAARAARIMREIM
jgi:hypothetical protein